MRIAVDLLAIAVSEVVLLYVANTYYEMTFCNKNSSSSNDNKVEISVSLD